MKNTIWVNKKKNTRYMVIDQALNCTNSLDGQAMIVYKSIDDSSLPLFVREKKEFLEKFYQED